MLLQEIMTPNVECVRPGDTLQEAARKMRDMDVGPMPVCGDGNRLIGMLTDRDITIRATAQGLDPKTARVQDAMSEEVLWCYEDQEVSEAERMMQERQVRRMLVMDHDKHLVGIVSLGDVATECRPAEGGQVLQDVSVPSAPRR